MIRAAAPLLVGALLLPAAAPAVAVPVVPGGLGGALVAAGVGRGAYAFPLESGRAVSVQQYTLAPNAVIRFGRTESTVLVFALYGELTNYLNCHMKQSLQEGQAHYVAHSKAAGTLSGMVANETGEDAEVLVLSSAVPGVPQRPDQLHRPNGVDENPPQPAAGCPTGPTATPVELGSAVATASGAFEQADHEIVSIYRYSLAPGTSTGWHVLPNPGFAVQTRGTVVAKQDCGAGVPHEAGHAYLNPGPETAQVVVNTSAESAEFLAVALSIPNTYPVDIAPAIPALAPSGCPDQNLV